MVYPIACANDRNIRKNDKEDVSDLVLKRQECFSKTIARLSLVKASMKKLQLETSVEFSEKIIEVQGFLKH
jgi:hypothetical protein